MSKTDNELIAEFMGVKYDIDQPTMKVLYDDDGIQFYCEWHPNHYIGTSVLSWEFAPDQNWCQLMPIVEKINKLDNWNISFFSNYEVVIFDTDYKLTAQGKVFRYEQGDWLKSAYKAVVEFIKWYNQKKP